MLPLSDGVWNVFFRGIGLGFLGGFVLIVVFFLTGGKYTGLTIARPSGLLYFLAGLEIGIALAVGLVFLVFHNLQAGGPHKPAWAQRISDQSKHGDASCHIRLASGVDRAGKVPPSA